MREAIMPLAGKPNHKSNHIELLMGSETSLFF